MLLILHTTLAMFVIQLTWLIQYHVRTHLPETKSPSVHMQAINSRDTYYHFRLSEVRPKLDLCQDLLLGR